MHEIKTVKTKKELKKLFNFLSETIYNECIENNLQYYSMSERYEEIKKQFDKDNDYLMYIEKGDKVIAGITGKNINYDNKKITIGLLAVDKNYRKLGLAKNLINNFEILCKNKNILHIDLGARFNACGLYNKLEYKYYLMVQVFDFVTIDDIRKNNKYNLVEKSFYQSDVYGYIFYDVNKIDKKYINCFQKNVKTAAVQYIFEKDL